MKAFVVDFRPAAIEMKTRKQLIVEEKIIEAKNKETEAQELKAEKGFEYHAIQAARYKFLGNCFLPDSLLSFEAYRVVAPQSVQL